MSSSIALLVLSVILGAIWFQGMRTGEASRREQMLTLAGATTTLCAAMAFAFAAFLKDT